MAAALALDLNPAAKSTVAAELYAKRNDEGMYTWAGVKYPSVTTILGYAKGDHLLRWYGKMASLRCTAHLVEAGIVEIDPSDRALWEFCSNLTPRSTTREQAVREILNWQKNMLEAERYRDHKARLGSLTHHAIYEHALGVRVAKDEIIDYLIGQAASMRLLHKDDDPTFEPTYAMLETLAQSAHAYVASAFEWIEQAQPEWEMIGLEAVVVHPYDDEGIGFAGTIDSLFTLKKSKYRSDTTPWQESWGQRRKFAGDVKTSNSLSKSVVKQIEAYRHCPFIGLMATGQEIEMPSTDGIAAIHVGPHPEISGHRDEFGTLESKANQLGTRLYTWEPSEDQWQGFRGLCQYVLSELEHHPAEGSRKRSEPKPYEPPKRTTARKAPF